ncbi:MAG: hypothetical protein AAGH43_14545 [Pseudomonadota bacterium]
MPLDLLYCDLSRIELFNAQSNSHGNRKTLTRARSTQRQSGTDTSGKLAGGVPGVVSADTAATAISRNQLEDSLGESFDPSLADAIAFIAQHIDLPEPSPTSAPGIGTLIKVSGALSVTDLGLVKELLAGKIVSKAVRQGAKQGIKASGKSGQSGFDETGFIFETLASFPHSVKAELTTGTSIFWCTLRDENLITPAHEILLKHGMQIPGRWEVLAILDAYPNDILPPEANELDVLINGLGAMIQPFIGPIRTLLGRPEHAYGITPIAIYREIVLKPSH